MMPKTDACKFSVNTFTQCWSWTLSYWFLNSYALYSAVVLVVLGSLVHLWDVKVVKALLKYLLCCLRRKWIGFREFTPAESIQILCYLLAFSVLFFPVYSSKWNFNCWGFASHYVCSYLWNKPTNPILF